MRQHEWIPGDRFINTNPASHAELGDEGVYLGPDGTLAWVLYDSPDVRNHFGWNISPTGHVGANTKNYRTMEFICHGEIPPLVADPVPVTTGPVPDSVPEESQSLWSLPKTW